MLNENANRVAVHSGLLQSSLGVLECLSKGLGSIRLDPAQLVSVEVLFLIVVDVPLAGKTPEDARIPLLPAGARSSPIHGLRGVLHPPWPSPRLFPNALLLLLDLLQVFSLNAAIAVQNFDRIASPIFLYDDAARIDQPLGQLDEQGHVAAKPDDPAESVAALRFGQPLFYSAKPRPLSSAPRWRERQYHLLRICFLELRRFELVLFVGEAVDLRPPV